MVQPNTFNMMLNSQIFAKMKQNAVKDGERTQMLLALVEEVI